MARRISGEVKKVLESAIANAENNHGLDIDKLIVSEAYVGKNLVMKRFRARARGRGARILKPFSELTIIVREVEEVEEAPAKTPAKHKTCRITIYTARPGVVIGKKGADIEVLRKRVASMVDGEVLRLWLTAKCSSTLLRFVSQKSMPTLSLMELRSSLNAASLSAAL